MVRLNIQAAKTHLSRHLAELTPGEVILLCRRNVPVAEIRLLPAAHTTKRPVGVAKECLAVPSSFFEPLPDELLAAFEGKGP
ncbi:MAG: type II toxin-antitoxin system Phd/YefM family antitoxin [Thermoanaerobaculia bacterium]|nr:type II toxin-antitoxin system Phd/YefM family antitoxin [Thermoanaerobaculia bacterium]